MQQLAFSTSALKSMAEEHGTLNCADHMRLRPYHIVQGIVYRVSYSKLQMQNNRITQHV